MKDSLNFIHKNKWASIVLEFLASMGLIHDVTSYLSISPQFGKIIFYITSSLFILYWLFHLFYKIIYLNNKVISLEGNLDSLKKEFAIEKEQLEKTTIEKYEDNLDNKKILSFVKKAKHLIMALKDKELNKTIEGLFSVFSDIPSVFENFFLPKGPSFIPEREHENGFKLWDGLNGITIVNYFKELNKSRKAILLGNFRIYALCVSGITDLLMKENLKTRVIVWTVLKKPLWRWYNMINISDNFYSSPIWWEKYLENVKDLTSTNQKFQMKRLIVEEKVSHKEVEIGKGEKSTTIRKYGMDQMFIYKEPLTFAQLREKIENNTFPMENLIDYLSEEEIPENEQGISNDKKCKIYPIAFKKIDGNWEKLRTHFEQEFGRFTHNNPLQQETGVFNKIINLNKNENKKDYLTRWLEIYDDIFIVEFTDNPQRFPKGFGIAFQASKTNDDRGIVVLDQGIIERYLEALEKKWEE